MYAMTANDPAKRPAIEEVIKEFSHIRNSLSESKLRSLITSRYKSTLTNTFLRGAQALRTVQNIISRKPAIPEPPEP